ncbi:tyrosine-type recombinase/integrase [Caballeronia sp. LjRoot31]|uniref:tyrosine-type recombinase/integrase n=1 Tax=Caballeronia sp. LjRoot31 TaxID=3342324 RepID=UPI003ECDEBAB
MAKKSTNSLDAPNDALGFSAAERGDPQSVLSREGKRIDTAAEVWQIAAHQRINWARLPLQNGPVRHAVQKHIENSIRTLSPTYAVAQFENLYRLFTCAKKTGFEVDIAETYDEAFFVAIRKALRNELRKAPRHASREVSRLASREVSLKAEKWRRVVTNKETYVATWFEKSARNKKLPKAYSKGTVVNTMDAYRRWFVFCADQEYEGFDQELATVLDNKVIGGNPKGHAVLSHDPNSGPLRYVEIAALQGRLLSGMQASLDSLDAFLVMWLSMSFGIYPKAMQYMNEEDLIRTDLPDGGVRYELRIPRLKKRGVNLRGQFHVRPVDPRVGALFEHKKRENRSIWRYVFFGRDSRDMERPMFPSWSPDSTLIGTPFERQAMRRPKSFFGEQLNAFVKASGIRAQDGSPLRITARRLRYTFATRLVREGASPTELAQALDHSDLQHVMVYFNSRSDAVISLDAAYALRLAPYAQLFLGLVIRDETKATRGNDPASRIHFADQRKLRTVGSCGSFSFCGLNAHRACYTCIKFQPWFEGPHEKVLDLLFKERQDLLERGVDLKVVEANDLTILAVAEVVRRCQEMSMNPPEVQP